MSKPSQAKLKNTIPKRQLTLRLSNYRSIFVAMAYRAGLSMEEVALIFGITKQNVSLIIKKEEQYAKNK